MPFETVIQRVTRRLADGLAETGAMVVPIGWNARLRRVETRPTRSAPEARPLGAIADDRATLLVPEVPLSLVAEGLDPVQLGRAYGLLTAALVHELIPIKISPPAGRSAACSKFGVGLELSWHTHGGLILGIGRWPRVRTQRPLRCR